MTQAEKASAATRKHHSLPYVPTQAYVPVSWCQEWELRLDKGDTSLLTEQKSLAGKAAEELCDQVHSFDKAPEPTAPWDALPYPRAVEPLGRRRNLQEISTSLDPSGILKRHLGSDSSPRSSSWTPSAVGICHTEQSSKVLRVSQLQICSAQGFVQGLAISQFPDASLNRHGTVFMLSSNTTLVPFLL